jgi:membrane protein implicated in regulation of membrane protease activity
MGKDKKEVFDMKIDDEMKAGLLAVPAVFLIVFGFFFALLAIFPWNFYGILMAIVGSAMFIEAIRLVRRSDKREDQRELLANYLGIPYGSD